MDQNVSESCFLVLWPLCWNCCLCLHTLFWFTNVDSFSYLHFICFHVFLGFVMPAGRRYAGIIDSPSAVNPGKMQRIGIVLLSLTFLSWIQSFR